MSDQASTLRGKQSHNRTTHVISVTSGKGGVGKSNLVVNVGQALVNQGEKVLAMDADMGLANIDILVGLTAEKNISHVLNGSCSIEEIIQTTQGGLHILPAASGIEWMANLTSDQKRAFLEKMDALNGLYDILLVDTGAGISSNVTYFNLAAQTRIVIVTPEPTSLTDAYAVIKVLSRSYEQKTFEVVVNQVKSANQGLEVFRNLTTVADRFLDVRLGYLGHIRHDAQLGRAVLQQVPLMRHAPNSEASKCYTAIAERVAGLAPPASGNELGLFWRKMLEKTPA